MKSNGDRQEPTLQGLQEHKSVGASRGVLKDSKAPECNCRYRFFLHALYTYHITLLVSFVVASIRQPHPSASPLTETLGAPTMPTSLSQDTDSSTPLPSSHATPVASATVMNGQCLPFNATKISAASSLCSQFSDMIGAVDVTIVCGNRELIA